MILLVVWHVLSGVLRHFRCYSAGIKSIGAVVLIVFYGVFVFYPVCAVYHKYGCVTTILYAYLRYFSFVSTFVIGFLILCNFHQQCGSAYCFMMQFLLFDGREFQGLSLLCFYLFLESRFKVDSVYSLRASVSFDLVIN